MPSPLSAGTSWPTSIRGWMRSWSKYGLYSDCTASRACAWNADVVCSSNFWVSPERSPEMLA